MDSDWVVWLGYLLSSRPNLSRTSGIITAGSHGEVHLTGSYSRDH